MGVVAAGAVTLMEEVVAGVDVVAEVAAEAQAKADPQTNLRSTKSLGFRLTSTTPRRNTQSSLQLKRRGFISTAQSPQLPSAKLLLYCAVMTCRESYYNGDLFGNHDDKSVLSKCSTWLNLTNPALVRQEKKTTLRK
jgi:hypothetical protein